MSSLKLQQKLLLSKMTNDEILAEAKERYEDCAYLLKIKDKIVANEEFKTK